jgi:hypothetical protein
MEYEDRHTGLVGFAIVCGFLTGLMALLMAAGAGLFVAASRRAARDLVPARPHQRPLGAGVSDETGESGGASSRG